MDKEGEMVTFKRLLVLITVLALLIVSSGTGCAPPPKAQVRIGGILADLHQLPFFVAQEKGFLAEEGIELKTVGPFADGPTVMNALQANELDMGFAGVSVAVTAAARKVDVAIIAGSNEEGTAVIADKAINSVSDLRGKTVAIPAAGSMQHILMGMLLAKNNMTFNDVNIILGTIKYPDMPGALETGKINAYMAPEPFAAQGVVRNIGKVLVTSAEMWPGHPC